MSLAARRLLLRASSHDHKRSRQVQLPSTSSPSNRRQLQTSNARWARSNKPPTPSSGDYNLRSDPEFAALDAKEKKWVEEFASRIESSGDIGPALDMLDSSNMEPNDKLELLSMLNKLEGLGSQEKHYMELAEALKSAPEDSEAIEGILEKMGTTPEEMQQAPKRTKKEIEKLGVFEEGQLPMESVTLRALDKVSGSDGDRIPSLAEAEKSLKPSFWKRWFGGEEMDRDTQDLLENTENLSQDELQREKRFFKRDPRINEMFGIIDKPSSEVDREARGFWNYGEAKGENMGEDEKFMEDDITSRGHAQLEQHREVRQYARWAVWELPLLSSKSSIPHLCNGG
jgi:hypothetical protein